MNPAADDLLRASLFSAYVHIVDLKGSGLLVDVIHRYAEELEMALMAGSSIHDAIDEMRAER